jgi:hypothetical protein
MYFTKAGKTFFGMRIGGMCGIWKWLCRRQAELLFHIYKPFAICAELQPIISFRNHISDHPNLAYPRDKIPA